MERNEIIGLLQDLQDHINPDRGDAFTKGFNQNALYRRITNTIFQISGSDWDVMYPQIKKEEKYLYKSIVAARQIQTFLWGEASGEWGLEEWRRMFRKRFKKIDDIKPENPHAIVELRKRLLQNAALSVALLGVLENGIPDIGSDIPSNLPEYAIE